jgi:hypothetical protein
MDTSNASDRRPGFKARLREELRRFLIMFVYLWLMFGNIVLNERVVLHEHGWGLPAHGFALLNALIAAKIMLIAECLNMGRWWRHRPLAYHIVFDASFVTGLFIAFHMVEHEVVGLLHGATAAASMPAIGGGGLAGLLTVAAILFISLIPFFAFQHLSWELGADRMKAILFGPPEESPLRDRGSNAVGAVGSRSARPVSPV